MIAIPKELTERENVLESVIKDIEIVKLHDNEDFSIEIMGKSYIERAEAGTALMEAAKHIMIGDRMEVGMYKEFTITVYRRFMQESNLYLSNNATYVTEMSERGLGAIARIENRYNRITNSKQQLEQKIEQLRKDKENAEMEYNKPFQYASLMEEKLTRQRELEHELKILLLPKDPNDDKDIVVEIRAGAGGEEAALFAAELFRMYVHYAQARGWKVEVLSGDETGIGGMKEVEFMVKGQGAYSIMKYESGVHRVQRIPVTESNGRIQTSTASVAVMPEAEEVDIHIDEKDIRIDVMRASGNGGQCVNTTDSAVRLTHYPTGIVIYSQTEKSQIQNKEKAFALLRAKLYDIETQKAHDAEADARRSQIGTGDRAEKIRTYNFPQGRVTDHRIGLTLYKLDKIMDGDIQDIIDACIAADQAAKLAKMGED